MKIAAYALAIAIGAMCVWAVWTDFYHLPFNADASAYWEAAGRLTRGEPLYVQPTPTLNPYLYAPWIAWLWVPLRLLHIGQAFVLWQLMELAVAVYVLWRAGPSPVTVALAVPLLVGVWLGNAQVLLVGILVAAIGTRWESVAVGVTGSVKGAPLAYALPWLQQRRLRSFTRSLAIALLLALPALYYGVDDYPATLHRFQFHTAQIALLGLAIVAAVVLTFALARTRWAWMAASLLILLATPQLLLYDFSWLLVGWVKSIELQHPRDVEDVRLGVRHRLRSTPLRIRPATGHDGDVG